MKTDGRPSGLWGWAAMLGVGAAYDVYAMKTRKVESLSEAFWRGSMPTHGGLVLVGIVAAVVYHLVIDNPNRKIGEKIQSLAEEVEEVASA